MTREDAIRMASAAMALAARAADEGEALAAAAGAERIMARFGLTEGDLGDPAAEDAAPDFGPIVDGEEAGAPLGPCVAGHYWRWTLADTLARLHGCYCWQSGKAYQIAGPAGQVETVRYLYAALAAECARWVDRKGAGLGRLWRNRYGDGFVARLGERLREARQAAVTDLRAECAGNARALVRIDRAAAALVSLRVDVAAQMRAKYRLRSSSSALRNDAGARAAGYRDGASASIGHGGRALPGGPRLLGGRS